MNVLVLSRAVAPLHGWGGLERAVADLCNGLAARGHRVTLVTTEPGVPPGDDSGPNVASRVTLPWSARPRIRRGSALDRALTYPRVVAAARQWIEARGETYDAAIGMGAMTAAAIPLREHGRVQRLILNPQGMEEFFGHAAKRLVLRPQQLLVRRAAHGADYVIATDAYLVATVMRTLRVPAERVVVIPNGVDVARIDALTARATEEPPAAFSLISVARIVPNKGLHLLADALGRVHERLPSDWRWTHVGDGPERGALDAAIARAGIGAHVTMLGHASDAELHHAFAAATLFVHPTLYEGSSLVTLEAMTHALPVIASAAGGIPDKVVPGVTGWLVPPGDARSLAEAIAAAASLPQENLRLMGAAGRSRVRESFSLGRTLDLTEALIATPGDTRRA
jgi:glycosyltransferase involved in cell wall biosynthesis